MADNAQAMVVLHGSHYSVQMILCRWNILQHDATMQRLMFHQSIADTIHGVKPSLHRTVLQLIWILQIISVFALTFISYNYTKRIKDNINPFMKGSLGKVDATTKFLIANPLVIEFTIRNFASFVPILMMCSLIVLLSLLRFC